MLSSNSFDAERCQHVAEGLRRVGYHPAEAAGARSATWRVSPKPLTLPHGYVEWLQTLGRHLHAFNRALDDLYLDSVCGREPEWIARYLEQGKPESLVRYGRTRQVRRSCPTVIRPDVIPTPTGMLITELDAVPGGMGIIACLYEIYRALGFHLIADDVPLPGAFAAMVEAVAGAEAPRLAIVVSDESASYRSEMAYLAEKLTEYGISARAVAPEDLRYSDSSVAVEGASGEVEVDVVYRFFELFDLPNVANAELLMRLNARNRVAVVPPFRAFFEEKLAMGMLHHPVLAPRWEKGLGNAGFTFLKECFAPTWILDPAPVPPYAAIPGLTAGGAAVNSWDRLKDLGRRQREFVIKPSGFSERAWGSRGVIVGHDISTPEWNAALEQALASFVETPHVLQEFRTGRQFEGLFYDTAAGAMRTIPCRARLSPYFLATDEDIRLTAVMATLCPLDKKKIHGMPEAIIVPCAVEETDGTEL
ncbi:MAG: hypothetical protein HY821_09950 [Acidobacteria bacterium]|nr:hypothetical protein [Acidobacteriota bacterium]